MEDHTMMGGDRGVLSVEYPDGAVSVREEGGWYVVRTTRGGDVIRTTSHHRTLAAALAAADSWVESRTEDGTMDRMEETRAKVDEIGYHRPATERGATWDLIERVLTGPGLCAECAQPVEPANETELQPGGRGHGRVEFCRLCWASLFEPGEPGEGV